jgi:hypothetical protein
MVTDIAHQSRTEILSDRQMLSRLLRKLSYYLDFPIMAHDLIPHFAVAKDRNSLKRGINMLETIIVILLVLWLVGLVAGQTFGGILHLLLVLALVVFLFRLFSGRRVA